MRAVDYEEIQPGDIILMDIPGNGMMAFEVEEINEEEHSVKCKDNWMDFYPNDDDQYIVKN